AQEAYTLRGTVLDAGTQRPLPDVSVTLRGTQARTTTNASGAYTLVARVSPGTYTLAFAQLGRGVASRSVTLGAEPAIQVPPVTLTETTLQLEGIVATGTGAPVERREVGNIVATVTGEEVNRAPGAVAVDQALQGKITGAVISQNNGQPGGGISIRLRGTNSILGNAEPLIVIDGVIVNNTSEALVGLGANATRGSAALSNRLSDIPPSDIERVEVLKGAAAAALYGSRANSGVIQIFTKRGRSGTPQVSFHTELSAASTGKRLPVNMVPIANRADSIAAGGVYRVGQAIPRFDYQDQLFRTGRGTVNDLSIGGGTDAGTQYYLSGNWTSNQGIFRGTDYNRAGVRARLNQRVSSLFEVGATLSYLRAKTNFVPEGEQTQGVLTSVLFTPTYYNPAFDANAGRYPYSPVIGTNPLDVINNWVASTEVNRFVGSVNATATPLRDLSVSYLFGLDQGQEEDVYLQPPFSTSSGFTGSIQNPIRNVRKFNSDLTATYDVGLRPSMRLASTGGMRFTSDRVNTVRAAASDLPPGGTDVVSGAVQTASQSITELRTLGWFLQERLSLRDRLFITAGLNREASSSFGRDARWQTFKRLGASYSISDEPFFRDSRLSDVFSTLRLRAAWGETGGQPPSEYASQNTYINVAFSGRPGLRPNLQAPNPGLKPEWEREIEAGFEAGFLRDRAALEATWYDKTTSELVLLVPLALTTGFTSQYQNIGELRNRGVELTLSTVNVQHSRFGWTSRLGYASNRNRIQKLNAASDTLVFDYLNAVIEGQPIGVFFGAYYPRDADGNIILAGPRNAGGFWVATPDGKRLPSRARGYNPARGDSSIVLRKVIGDPNPDFTASFQNTFTYRGLELSVLLDGRFGNDVANFTRRSGDFFGSSANLGIESRGDTAAGTFSRNADRNLLYEEFIEDGTFVKLREVALQFRFEQPWVHRFTGARAATLRVSGRNLHTWTSYSGMDPEVNLFAASTVSRGVDFATTPIPRTISVGLGFDF
ncbi:MAG TPA: SusC/RagA family TonB-linked outer membrane protein, partial [Longimicrobiaceae bacterium]|nr:SusC/RagA family TonB-linked outer membrane protein [Longimicrobiaceae bacterium]